MLDQTLFLFVGKWINFSFGCLYSALPKLSITDYWPSIRAFLCPIKIALNRIRKQNRYWFFLPDRRVFDNFGKAQFSLYVQPLSSTAKRLWLKQPHRIISDSSLKISSCIPNSGKRFPSLCHDKPFNPFAGNNRFYKFRSQSSDDPKNVVGHEFHNITLL